MPDLVVIDVDGGHQDRYDDRENKNLLQATVAYE